MRDAEVIGHGLNGDRWNLRGPKYEAILLALGCLVVTVWAISVLVQLIDPKRIVPSGVNEVTLAVVAGLFGGAAIAGSKRRNGGRNGGGGNNNA